MSNELTEAERAAADVLLYEEGSEWPEDTERHEEIARAVVAAVAPIIKRETLDRFGDRMGTFNPPLDVNKMNRGFGYCTYCEAPPLSKCHECGTTALRKEAHGLGWRMDHLGGFGCIAICPACRNDNP